MNCQNNNVILKIGLSLAWVASLLYYFAGGGISSIAMIWAVSTLTLSVFLLTIRKTQDNRKSNWVFLLLFGINCMLFCVSFMGLVGIGSTKEDMLMTIDDWIDINIFHSIGFSCVILIGTILPRRLLSRQSRILIIVNAVYFVFSMVVTIYFASRKEIYIAETWPEWSNPAWVIQILYFACLPICLIVLLCASINWHQLAQ